MRFCRKRSGRRTVSAPLNLGEEAEEDLDDSLKSRRFRNMRAW
jgi:hypothetical protein